MKTLSQKCIDILNDKKLSFKAAKKKIAELLVPANLPTPSMTKIKWRPAKTDW